ncbi:glycosyltransferase [Chlamydiota bacterium]
MKICFFGTYDKYRLRNKVLIKGFRKNGVEVLECHFPLWEGIADKSQVLNFQKIVKKIYSAFLAYPFLIIKYIFAPCHDLVIVGYLGHFDVFIAKVLAFLRGKKVVLNVHISLYDTVVEDRKIVAEGNVLAKFLYYLDKTACLVADKILVDTDEYKRYFVEKFGLPQKKFITVYVGADEELFYPEHTNKNPDIFLVLFYGQFIPLQGVEYIIRAAAELFSHKDIQFRLVGKGQVKEEMVALSRKLNVNNIRWIDWATVEKLREMINEADVCLGVFGKSEKSARVIPNKVFQPSACARPIITKDCAGVREIYLDKHDALLCKNAWELSKDILFLKANKNLREKLARNAFKTFEDKLMPVKICKRFLDVLVKEKVIKV